MDMKEYHELMSEVAKLKMEYPGQHPAITAFAERFIAYVAKEHPRKHTTMTPPISGFARQWTECKTCGNVAYYDYTPNGLGRPILTLPCGHDLGQRFQDCINEITEEEALHKLKEETPLTHKCIVKNCQNHKHQGEFVGDLCMPCYTFISKGSGTYSQAYRNALDLQTTVEADTYDVCLYLSQGPFFKEDTLVQEIGNFQEQNGIQFPIRVTAIQFVAGSYNEKGWECAAACYSSAKHDHKNIINFMHLLAQHLVSRYKQTRISVKGIAVKKNRT